MKMKKFVVWLLCTTLLATCTACSKDEEKIADVEPQLSQMKAICDLAVMQCYYHNVAKYKEENASGFWLWAKDKHFWIEYSGVVTLGIDTSQVYMEIDGDTVTITMPEAEVLDCLVDSNSLVADSFIVDQNSAAITAEDETVAFANAQVDMRMSAESDRVLLNSARQRAQSLLENYVNSIGAAMQKQYTVKFVDANGSKLNPAVDQPVSSEEANEPQATYK